MGKIKIEYFGDDDREDLETNFYPKNEYALVEIWQHADGEYLFFEKNKPTTDREKNKRRMGSDRILNQFKSLQFDEVAPFFAKLNAKERSRLTSIILWEMTRDKFEHTRRHK